MVDAYKAVLDAGKLTSHVAVSLKWKNEEGLEQFPGLLKAAERANALGISTRTVKFYVDGVIPQKTAFMLAPYENSGDERGTPQIAPEVLKQAVTAADAKGMHAFQIGRAHVSTPVTNAHLVCRLLLEKKKH